MRVFKSFIFHSIGLIFELKYINISVLIHASGLEPLGRNGEEFFQARSQI